MQNKWEIRGLSIPNLQMYFGTALVSWSSIGALAGSDTSVVKTSE